MPIDPYSPCPGGTGKKIKFCCPDLTGELEKIAKMIEGEQRVACLEYIENLEGRYPDRACLLSLKAMLEARSGSREKAEATLASYIEKYPDNPVALAETAALKATQEGGRAAVESLQKAIAACGQQIPVQLFDAIGLVAQALLAEGHILAARAHLVMQLAIGQAEQSRAMNLLVGINGSPAVPLLLKEDLPLAPAPDDALWKKSFTAATELAMRGAWQSAADQLGELAAKAGDWPQMWRNIATLRCWLADPTAADALRKYAQQQIPLDDAVEAEALAQLLDEGSLTTVDVLTITYPAPDFEKLLARVSASKQAARIPIDPARLAGEDEPPPKGAFWLLDRPVPSTGVGIRRQDVPRVIGQLLLFGKQTDRSARLELVTYRTSELSESQNAIQSILGEALEAPGPEEITTQVPATQHVLSWNWRLPDDTPASERERLIAEEREAAILEKWPNLPQKMFGGRSARDAAADGVHRIKLLSAILLLELSADQAAAQFDYNQLRTALGLPPAAKIIPPVNIRQLPLARLARLDAPKLETSDLVEAYYRADHYRHVRALKQLAAEVVNRSDLPKEFDKAAAYGALAEVETDVHVALSHLESARKEAEAAGRSSGPWDVAELALRLSQGQVDEADRVLQHIRDEHLREPGVAQALYQVLAEAGIIGPDGAPVGAAPAAQSAGSPLGGIPSTMAPEAAPAAASKLWTPGAATPSGKKSTIWTPD